MDPTIVGNWAKTGVLTLHSDHAGGYIVGWYCWEFSPAIDCSLPAGACRGSKYEHGKSLKERKL